MLKWLKNTGKAIGKAAVELLANALYQGPR